MLNVCLHSGELANDYNILFNAATILKHWSVIQSSFASRDLVDMGGHSSVT